MQLISKCHSQLVTLCIWKWLRSKNTVKSGIIQIIPPLIDKYTMQTGCFGRVKNLTATEKVAAKLWNHTYVLLCTSLNANSKIWYPIQYLKQTHGLLYCTRIITLQLGARVVKASAPYSISCWLEFLCQLLPSHGMIEHILRPARARALQLMVNWAKSLNYCDSG